MKFLILSIDGDALGIAEQFVRAGHDVRYWIKNPNMRRAGEGLVNRVPSWRPHIGWADLVLADMVGLSSFGKRITPRAKAHLGFTLIADAMELDRQKQMDLLKKVFRQDAKANDLLLSILEVEDRMSSFLSGGMSTPEQRPVPESDAP